MTIEVDDNLILNELLFNSQLNKIFLCREGCVDVGYSLVECLECHSMYHQNCHTPPITDINLNDPRIVWYCSSCRQKDTQKTVS